MKRIRYLILLTILLTTSLSCCKDDDDNPSNDSDNFSEYFKCKINGVEFTTRSDFNCNGKTFYYYPAGAGGLEEAYMIISGRDCSTNLSVSLQIFNPEIPSIGTFTLSDPQFADSISSRIRHHVIGDDVYVYSHLVEGNISINTFSPRDSTTMEFGKLEGTFDFTVFNEELDSTVHVTDGSFRFKVANFW